MTDLEYLKQFREIREIADIIGDIEKLDSLMEQNEWDSVSQLLYVISAKHPAEKVVYNSANPLPPLSIQQSASSCRQFLIALGKAKITAEGLKHMGGSQNVH